MKIKNSYFGNVYEYGRCTIVYMPLHLEISPLCNLNSRRPKKMDYTFANSLWYPVTMLLFHHQLYSSLPGNPQVPACSCQIFGSAGKSHIQTTHTLDALLYLSLSGCPLVRLEI